MAKVTYTPLENGDPLSTTVHGFCFAANTPVEIPDTATIVQLQRVEERNADGLLRARTVETEVRVTDLLSSNPYFRIEGKVQPKRPEPPKIPTTPEEYRAHAHRWLAATTSHTALEKRWNDEAALREKIGLSDDGDDMKILRPVFANRHYHLERLGNDV